MSERDQHETIARKQSVENTRTEYGARSGIDVMDAIYGRRAVRSYSVRKVEAEIVRRLIDAAIRAPSAFNSQPWSFVVIQDRERLRRLSERAKSLALASARVGTPMWSHGAMLAEPSFNVFYDGGTLIVICARSSGSWPANEDCFLAGQNLMLAAYGLGLGTCPIGFAREALNESHTKAELAIPEDYAVVLPILVGYPRSASQPVERDAPHILSWS